MGAASSMIMIAPSVIVLWLIFRTLVNREKRIPAGLLLEKNDRDSSRRNRKRTKLRRIKKLRKVANLLAREVLALTQKRSCSLDAIAEISVEDLGLKVTWNNRESEWIKLADVGFKLQGDYTDPTRRILAEELAGCLGTKRFAVKHTYHTKSVSTREVTLKQSGSKIEVTDRPKSEIEIFYLLVPKAELQAEIDRWDAEEKKQKSLKSL